jgi:hypothetical protein
MTACRDRDSAVPTLIPAQNQLHFYRPKFLVTRQYIYVFCRELPYFIIFTSPIQIESPKMVRDVGMYLLFLVSFGREIWATCLPDRGIWEWLVAPGIVIKYIFIQISPPSGLPLSSLNYTFNAIFP